MPNLFPIIGLEIHVQLNTKTKLFCRCLNEYVPDEPNKNICEFCTGQPGALPFLNKIAVQKAISFGVAVNAKIPSKTRWDRKNYFYPDLPAGYQISQYDNPIVEGGKVEFYIDNEDGKNYLKSTINLTRAHLESDAGKSLHVGEKTLVDYNRSGSPLIEIVTEPEIRSTPEAMAFVSELQLLVRTLDISGADMEKGQMRFDCNISLQTPEQKEAGKLPSYKVEIKNINSIRALGRAIESEIIRQTKLLEEGEIPAQETRGWRDDLNKSVSQRGKEDAHDYRYFPEPDLQILAISEKDIPSKNELPILPMRKREKYLEKGLNLQITNLFVSQSEVGELFNQTVELITEGGSNYQEIYRAVGNLVSGGVLSQALKLGIPISKVLTATQVLELAELFRQKKISNQALSKAIEILTQNPDKNTLETIEKENLMQVSDDSALQIFVDSVITNNTAVVQQYKSGKVQVIGFLVGACMKASQGKGNPQRFKELLEKSLTA